MADVVETPTEPTQEPAPQPVERKSLLRKAKLLIFAALVVAVECAVAYLYLPGVAEATDMPAPPPKPKAHALPVPDEKSAESHHEGQVERELGQFSVTSFQPATSTALRIDFTLYATIAAEDGEHFDLAMEHSRHRIRDQIIVIVRSCDLDDLTDAGLGLIKRRILEKTNHTLGKQYVKAVFFSDFSFIEQ
jgi:flagellar FliL protein